MRPLTGTSLPSGPSLACPGPRQLPREAGGTSLPFGQDTKVDKVSGHFLAPAGFTPVLFWGCPHLPSLCQVTPVLLYPPVPGPRVPSPCACLSLPPHPALPSSPLWDGSRLPLGLWGGPSTSQGAPLTSPFSPLTSLLTTFLGVLPLETRLPRLAARGAGRRHGGPAPLSASSWGGHSRRAPRQTRTCPSCQLGPEAPRDGLVSTAQGEPAHGTAGRWGMHRPPAWTAPHLEDRWSPHHGAEATAEAP